MSTVTKSGKRSIEIPAESPINKEGDDDGSVWSASAFIALMRGKNRVLLKYETMRDILSQIRDGSVFSLKTLKTGTFLGQSEYDLARKWMLSQGLIERTNGGYRVASVQSVRDRWNATIQGGTEL